MFAVILSLLLSAQAGYDIIIKNGMVVDGSGAERFQADIAIRGDRIVRVDRGGIDADKAIPQTNSPAANPTRKTSTPRNSSRRNCEGSKK